MSFRRRKEWPYATVSVPQAVQPADIASSSILTRATGTMKLAASLMTVLGHKWVRVTYMVSGIWLQLFVG